jgi:plastocyanin
MKWSKFLFVIAVSLCFTYARAGNISGKVKAKGVKHNGNAIIYIEKIAGKDFTPPKEHATMDQIKMEFLPHVLPVLVGTTVDFLNNDDVLHNVNCPDQCAEKFNLGTWPKGQVHSYTFKKAGCAPAILCNIHPEMEAYVFVTETPYFSVSEKDGSYSIKNVPAGTYTLNIWHEKLKGQAVSVDVPEKGDVTINFDIQR